MLFELFKDLKENISQPNLVIQSDNHKLWIIMPYKNLLEDTLSIMDVVSRQRQIKNIPLYIDFSIGTSACDTVHELTKLSTFENSDLACRHAQTNNLPYAIFDLSKQRLKTEYTLLSTFLYALESHQTFLVFQPKIDLKTKRTIGLEALIRWQHPERGLIPPDVFIPLIEETKLIHILTDWVLEQTLTFLKVLISTHQELPISINVSAKNLFDPQFYDRFMSIMRKHQVSTSLIHIEITESTLMMQPEESKVILQKFKNEGIKVELDDFGKGYSSLAYLAQFPIDTIKIDRFFMQNIVDDFAIQEIVRATIGLSKKLGYHVLAEGIETIAVEDLLMDLGCDHAQGYFYAKPLSQDDMIIWLKKS